MCPRPPRSRRMLSALVASAVVVALACGPIRDVPTALPRNACPEFPCSAYASATTPPVCGGGVCVVNGQINPVLAIDLSETDYSGPASLAVTYSDLANDAFHALGGKPAPCPSCVVLPPLGATEGTMTIRPEVEASVGYPLRPAGALITLPAHVRYRPLWQLARGTTPVDAALAGLPLLPIDAQLNVPGGNGGPESTPTLGWSTSLMPGVYERSIEPIPPFDAIFPPQVKLVTLPRDGAGDVLIEDVDDHLALETFHGLRIVRDGLDHSLEGWTVYLRDLSTGRRVSQIETLHDATLASTFRLHTLFDTPPVSTTSIRTQTVVSPPVGQSEGIPTLVNNNVPGPNLAADAPIDHPLHYPAIPFPVFVTGTVGVATGAAIDADLIIRETSLVTLDPGDPALHSIHYSTRAKAVRGVYGVSLPPGVFDVYVIPSADSPFSATSTKLEIARSTSGSASGKDLPVLRRASLTGTCIIDDGRPLAGAEVEARPGAVLVATVDQDRWPRAQRTTTDANGFFSMSLDQGTYDIVVRPPPGSALPWTISRSHTLLTSDPVHLDVIRVPAPYVIELTLLETTSANSYASRALVRAYAFAGAPAGGTSGAGSGSGGTGASSAASAIQIGEALADEGGHFRMFLAPLQ